MKLLNYLKAVPATVGIMILLKSLYGVLFALVTEASLNEGKFWDNYLQAFMEPILMFQIIGVVIFICFVVLIHLKSRFQNG
ncbi:MAG: hypothetical protein KBG80_06205 [Breznakibacter sp.]|nr:hypothetical protein [Breznakibacter sp.]